MSSALLPATAQSCRVCRTLPALQTVELDGLMGDPQRWNIDVAYGALTPQRFSPSARKIGAVNVGLRWAHDHGYQMLNRADILRHYTRHTPLIAHTLEEYAEFAVVGDPSSRHRRVVGLAGVGEVYNKAVDLGVMSLTLLIARLEERIRRGETVPSAELMAYAEYGAKLAISAAGLRRSGASPFGGERGAYEGFRGGEGAPGPKISRDVRMRTINGESRPVIDRGPKDRAAYNARAELEGRDKLA
jgi:hypothetical protein